MTTTSILTANQSKPANNATAGIAISADVAARVQRTLASQSSGIDKLNDALARDKTKLSGLGQLHSALASFEASAGAGVGVKSDAAAKPDADQIGQNVKSFVAAFNTLNQKLQTLQKGDLKSDVAIGQVSAQISALVKTGGGVSIAALNDAGVTLQSNGDMKVDDKKLAAALTADASAVSKLFTNGGKGLADQLAAKAASLTSSGGGIGRETAGATKDLAGVEAKRTAMTKALTAQAGALASLYTQQAQAKSGHATSLFDMLA